jgi:POT family proton-dependent oligopeptide transporter
MRTSHPKGLYLLFVTEMWERFSYYGMRAIFFLFLTKALLFTHEDASNIYGDFTGLVYLTPLLGGYISDRYWGNRRSIVFGGLLMAIGQFFLFLSSTYYHSSFALSLMIIGLLFLVVGNGFFKPNISTMVGQLYAPGDARTDAAYTIFYMGINLGAFFSPLICGTLGDTSNPADFRWGFLSACIGMLVGLALFLSLKGKYLNSYDGRPVGLKPVRKK